MKCWIWGAAPALLVATSAAIIVFRWWGSAPSSLPVKDWAIFRSALITEEGRVVDNGNGGISHSEGQGYGMLIAEAYRDRRIFDRIWGWTRRNLQVRKGDKLLAWKWTPEDGGRVADLNNASDGDLLVAWALVRAWRTWGDFYYHQSAFEILADLRRQSVAIVRGRRQLLPGTEGFVHADGVILNPSYYIFPAFEELEEAFPGDGWQELAESGWELLREARFGRWRLAPDWVRVPAGGAPLDLETGFPTEFGYNAVRVPLYAAWGGASRRFLEPFVDFWSSLSGGTEIPATVNLETNDFGLHPALPGMRAVAAFTQAFAQGSKPLLSLLPSLEPGEVYYSAVLKLLVKIAVRDLSMKEGRNW